MSKHRLDPRPLARRRFVPAAVLAVLMASFAVLASGPAEAAGTVYIDADDVSVVEGDSGTSFLQFEVYLTRTNENFDPVSVQYITTSGTAKAPEDYQTSSGTLTFSGLENSKTVSVPIHGDTAVEPDENLYLELYGAANGTVSDPLYSAIGTIVNDDQDFALTVSAVSQNRSDQVNPNALSPSAQGIVTSTPAGISCHGVNPLRFIDQPGDCSEEYAKGTQVTLKATPLTTQSTDNPNEMSVFRGWGGACEGSGTALTCTLPMTQARTVTATFGLDPLPKKFALNATATATSRPTPSGYSTLSKDFANGTITSSPAGIECDSRSVDELGAVPTDCSEQYQEGTQVTLTATAKEVRSSTNPTTEMSVFQGWGGACANAGTAPTCIVTMSQARDVSAAFGFSSSAKKTLTVAVTNKTRLSYSVNPELAAGAVTSKPLGISCSGQDGVKGTPGPKDCTEDYDPSVVVTLTATPQLIRGPYGPLGSYTETTDMSTFDGWGGACAAAGKAPTCTIPMDQARSVTATFGAPVYQDLTVAVTNGTSYGTGVFGNAERDSANGTVTSSPSGISCSGSLVSGDQAEQPRDCIERFPSTTTVTLTAAPKPVRVASVFSYLDSTEMSVFRGWGGACALRGSLPTCTVTMAQARLVSAVFVVPARTKLTVAVTNQTRPSTSPLPTTSPDYANGTINYISQIVCSGPRAVADVNDRPKDCTQYYSPTQSITLEARPKPIRIASPGFFYDSSTDISTFEGWGGACAGAGKALRCTVSMDQARSVTATFGAPVMRTLRVAVTNKSRPATATSGYLSTEFANGGVTSAPAGIDCSGALAPGDQGAANYTDCARGYPLSTTVTLTAKPQPVRYNNGQYFTDAAELSSFEGWGGACSSQGTTPTCTVTMTQARSVTATFGFVPKFALDVSATNEARVNPAAASPMTPDRASGVVTSQPGGITCNEVEIGQSPLPDCAEDFASGTLVTLSATAKPVRTISGLSYVDTNEMSIFRGWGGACASRRTASTCIVTMSQARSVTAAFGLAPLPTKYTLGVTATNETRANPAAASPMTPDWASGVVTSQPGGITCNEVEIGQSPLPDCTEDLVAGTVVTLTATAKPVRTISGVSYVDTSEMSVFRGWGGACAGSGTAATCTVTMSQARSVTAAFGLTPLATKYTLDVSATNATRANPNSGPITPDYSSGAVTSQPAGINCRAIEVVDSGPLPDCTEDFVAGTLVTLTATAKPVRRLSGAEYVEISEMSVFKGWGGACLSRGTAATCTVTMSQARSVTAAFGFVSRT